MKLYSLDIHPYKIPIHFYGLRSLFLIKLMSGGNQAWGEIAPYLSLSRETLKEAKEQFDQKKDEILKVDWNLTSYRIELARLNLFPSVAFGLEAALLSLMDPLENYSIPASALLMGSEKEILDQAELRFNEGFTTAKLKVGHLDFKTAKKLIDFLKDKFRLRIDVNRAWNAIDAHNFFSEFSQDAFDYIEEPFDQPKELSKFTHPLAIDESFFNLSFNELESLPTLKTIVYKPTIHGGLSRLLPIQEWANKRGINIVLSSAFESDLGLVCIASIAKRLLLKEPIGIGTYHFLKENIYFPSLNFSQSFAHISKNLYLKLI